MILLLLALQEQTATYYHSPGYSPDYLIRTRPWASVAIDARGEVYAAHPTAVDAGNRRVDGGLLRIFDAGGEELLCHRGEHWMPTAGLAVAGSRILLAADQQQVWAFERKGSALVRLPTAPGLKEGGRCVGLSLGKGGDLFTADMGVEKVFRFYPPGGSSSFGSGPGAGEQGFNHLRRVFESPANGNLAVLDGDGVRLFGPTGRFLKRVAPGGVLAMGPDGRMLVARGAQLELTDAEGKPLKKFPIAPDAILDAALAGDGSFCVLPRGEEHCVAAYDAEGRLRWRRGSDVERLTVRLRPDRTADVELSTGLALGLLTPAEAKRAEGRPRKVSRFVQADGAWTPLEGPVPAGATALRFTTAATADGPGAAVTFRLP